MSYFSDFPHTRNSDQDFGELIKQYVELNVRYENMVKAVEKCDENNKELQKELAEIQKEINDYVSGKLIPAYLEATKKYINENLIDFVSEIVKYVVFGISADGHFVAYIPASWDFIQFDTVYDQTSELFGHLVLRW